MVQECTADHERVGEVQTRHGSKLIDILAANPHGLGVVLPNGVVESVRFRQQTRWHAWPHGKDEEGSKVG